MEHIGRKRRSLMTQLKGYTYHLPRRIVQTASLPNFESKEKCIARKGEEKCIARKRVKSLCEIYAPVYSASKLNSRLKKPRKKKSHFLQTKKNISSKKIISPNIPPHWLSEVKPHSKHQINKESGDWFQESLSIPKRRRGVKAALFDGETLVSRFSKMEQESENFSEAIPEGPEVEMEEIVENDDQDSPRESSVVEAQDETLTPENGSQKSVAEEEEEEGEKEVVNEETNADEIPMETEVADEDETRQQSLSLDIEKESSKLESILEPKKESPRFAMFKGKMSITCDTLYESPSLIREMNETLGVLCEAQAQVSDLKKLTEQLKDAALTEKNTKETEEKEELMKEKLREVESAARKLAELIGQQQSECDSSDIGTDILSEECKELEFMKKCDKKFPSLNFGYDMPKLDSCFEGRDFRKSSIFSAQSFKKSQKLPFVSSFLSKAFELPKVIMCRTAENMPKIILGDDKKKLNIASAKPDWPYPNIDESMDPKNEVVICLTDRLNESYNLQEKLAFDNTHLEEFGYQMQEEVIAKEQALEDLKRKYCNIQNEMKLLVWENKKLQNKITQKQQPKKNCRKDQGKKMEENLVSRLEMQMNNIENDLKCVQLARKQADIERCKLKEAANSFRSARPTTCPPENRDDRNGEKFLQMKEQYARLKDDYKSKVTQVASLQVENENLVVEIEDKKKCLDQAEYIIKDLQEKLMAAEMEKEKFQVPKGQTSQLMYVEQQLREAKDELEDFDMKLQESIHQEEYYREKYLLAQQQVEEQRRQIDMMEADNKRITKQVDEEILNVKCQFQGKLDELKSLPSVLRSTQCKLQEALQKERCYEKKLHQLKAKAEEAEARANEAAHRLDDYITEHQEAITQVDALKAKSSAWEKKCKDLEDCNCKLKQEVKKLEECVAQCRRCSEEKAMEVIQISNQLECVREESARQVAKAKERCETVRRSYQCQVEELERKLAQSRANACAAQMERDETRKRMQCEISNLSENFEQAQSRIRYLQSHVNYLKKSCSNILEYAAEDNNGGMFDDDDFCNCD